MALVAMALPSNCVRIASKILFHDCLDFLCPFDLFFRSFHFPYLPFLDYRISKRLGYVKEKMHLFSLLLKINMPDIG